MPSEQGLGVWERCPELGRRRFLVWEVPDGWSVVDLYEEAIARPRRRWDAEAAELVASSLDTRPGYAAQLSWSSLATMGAGR